MKGFESYNKFVDNLKDLQQIYDFTYHLYLKENDEIKMAIAANAPHTILTQIGSISHSLNHLFEYTKFQYPNKLRQLTLINAITTLEVYYTDLLEEISKRDISPFMTEEPLSMPKNQLLSFASIKRIEENIVSKLCRSITSGGYDVARKTYNTYLRIDFGALNLNLANLEEIYTRRHLHVHRNGMADADYSRKYPVANIHPGQYLLITHDYLLDSLSAMRMFASKINEKALQLYPDPLRKPIVRKGNRAIQRTDIKLLVKAEITGRFDLNAFVNIPVINGQILDVFLLQIIQEEKNLYIFISACKRELRILMHFLKSNQALYVRETNEIKF